MKRLGPSSLCLDICDVRQNDKLLNEQKTSERVAIAYHFHCFIAPEIFFYLLSTPSFPYREFFYMICWSMGSLNWTLYWVCSELQELKKLGLGPAVDLHITEVPVEYQAVQKLLPSLWDQYHPQVLLVGTFNNHTILVRDLLSPRISHRNSTGIHPENRGPTSLQVTMYTHALVQCINQILIKASHNYLKIKCDRGKKKILLCILYWNNALIYLAQ